MGRFYGVKIQNGDMMIDEVPKLWKTATQNWLSINMN